MEDRKVSNIADRLAQLSQLPPGYEFGDRVSAHEVMQLRRSVGWDAGNDGIWGACIEQSILVRGVRTGSGELVGIGFIAGNGRHAILCDLCVHPDHQGKGIGLALVAARLAKAEKMKIPYLYTSLAAKNPLRSLYEEFGFASDGNQYFRAKNL